ncbi:MAG: hypothetical protein ABW115_13600 [Candidatus Thiodiazotropha sp. 6PLUC6]
MDTSIVTDTFFKPARITVFATLLLHLFACDSSSKDNQEDPDQYRVGVTVNDLYGGSLVLQNSNQDRLNISEDGHYTFTSILYDGESYHVTVVTQPVNQNCNVENSTGTIDGSDISDLIVTCQAIDYRVSGYVTGLTGSGLVIQNNGGDDLSISSNSDFIFPTELEPGHDYLVAIATQPNGQTCRVVNGSGTLNDRQHTQVVISCPLSSVTPEVKGINPKKLHFSWNNVGAEYYRLLKNPDGQSGYTQVGDKITDTQVDETISVHLTDWDNASYLVQACNGADLCTDSPPLSISSAMIQSIGYIKADDIERNNFGGQMSLSNDGNTLAVFSTAGIHIFSNEGTHWQQQTLIETVSSSLSLSGDGTTLATAYIFHDTNGEGGIVRIFTRNGDTWDHQAYLNPTNPETDDRFGHVIALSNDGDTLAVSAYLFDSTATDENGDETDDPAPDLGAVYLFIREGNAWRQQAYIKPSISDADDRFGSSIALSDDGDALAVSATYESSSATGIEGDQTDNSTESSGAIYLFERQDNSIWNQTAYIKASNPDPSDVIGRALALSSDGHILAVGTALEDSIARGINGDQSDNSSSRAGAVYLFSDNTGSWRQQAYIKASNTRAERVCPIYGTSPCPPKNASFGSSLALSGDGSILSIGAPSEYSPNTAFEPIDAPFQTGAIYLY